MLSKYVTFTCFNKSDCAKFLSDLGIFSSTFLLSASFSVIISPRDFFLVILISTFPILVHFCALLLLFLFLILACFFCLFFCF